MMRDRRRQQAARPGLEACEVRLLLSTVPAPRATAAAVRPLVMPGFNHPLRPNLPVLPYAAPYASATFIDPSVRVLDGSRASVGVQTYIAPYATLNAQGGYLKLGSQSYIQDEAQLLANPGGQRGEVGITIGDATVIGFNAAVIGPAQVGDYGALARPTYVGPNAVIDGATIAPGAFVSARAYVGPGLTIATGVKVLPGAQVNTAAEATDPALGKVGAVTAADLTFVQTSLSDSAELASGYARLYQGNAATGRSPGTTDTTIFNGDLSLVSGSSPQPGKTFVSFEPARNSPKFPSPARGPAQANLANFRGRIIGGVTFGQRAGDVAHRLGRGVSIRGDVGQPIVIGSIARLGDAVVIHAPRGGSLTIGTNFRAEAGATILGGKAAVIGNGVQVGQGAVLDNAKIGDGAVIGAGSVIRNTTIPAGSVVPPNSILIG